MATGFLATLDKIEVGNIVALDAGQSVFRQGGMIRWLHRVVSGRVRLSRTLARGSEITLARVGTDGILAEASVFASRYHCDAIAETDSTVRRYPMREIQARLRTAPEAATAYGAHLAAELMDLRAMVEIRAIRRADDRLLAWLRFRAPGTSHAFDGHGVWSSVAKQIGLTGESVYRALARLERDGNIRRSDGRVFLVPGP